MKSPTSSILHSIQALKSKLRSDQLQLQGIRRDFAMGPTRTILQMQQRSQSPIGNPRSGLNFNQYKSNHSLQKYTKSKMIQLRKTHQAEIKNLSDKFRAQKQQLANYYETKINELTQIWEQKATEQQSYIQLLEQQIQRQKQAQVHIKQNSPPKSAKCKMNIVSKLYQINCNQMTFINKINFKGFSQSVNRQEHIAISTTQNIQQSNIKQIFSIKNEAENKYQNIVNSLLAQNANLLQTVERLKMQNRRLCHNSSLKEQISTRNDLEQLTKKMNQVRIINESSVGRNSVSSQYFSIPAPSVSDNLQQSSYRSGCVSKKNRLKFSKARDNKLHVMQTNRSFVSLNNQNIDISNIAYRNANSIQKQEKHQRSLIENSIVEQEEESILSQEMKLKTIKHFMKMISHRSTEAEDLPVKSEIQTIFQPKNVPKRGQGIRNALKSISALQYS